jgi:lipase
VTPNLVLHEWGDPAGRPLLHLHKASSSGRQVAELAPILVRDHGLRVLAPDLPGHGRSPAVEPEGFAPAPLLDLLESLLDERGVERTAVMGNSWGGFLAVRLAARSPERVSALVLLDSGHIDYADLPGIDPDETLEGAIEAAGAPEWNPTFAGWDEWEAAQRERFRRWSPAVDELLRYCVEERDGAVRSTVAPEAAGATRWGLIHERVSPAWPAIADAGIPTLLLLAGRPPEAAAMNEPWARRFAAAIPHADVRTMSDWAHDLPVEGGPELAAVVGGWLAAH